MGGAWAPQEGMAVIGTSEKTYLLSGVRLKSMEVKLNRAIDAAEAGGLEAQRLGDCVHHIVEAGRLLDALADSERH